jgi:hypothetical protein
MPDKRDFFISFNKADSNWAGWIAWTLELNGYKVFYQDWDFGTGSNFPLQIHQALQNSNGVIAVLSADYLQSGFGAAEWAAAFTEDPTGAGHKLRAYP